MFNFMKKGVGVGERDREKTNREKDRRKKEKKQRKDITKQNILGTMSSEELLRLDEVRRSLKIRGRRKEKEKLPSGITADYSANFFAHLDLDRDVERDRGVEEVMADANATIDNNGDVGDHVVSINVSHSDSSETSLQSVGANKVRVLPPVPPKPKKRGILKGPRNSTGSRDLHHRQANSHNLSADNADELIKNTLQNELITYENLSSKRATTTSTDNHHTEENANTNLVIMTSASPSAESLTDTTNSSFVTPPFSMSPVGESQSFHRWSRVQTFEGVELPQSFKPVIFAEPGTNSNNTTGLLPGDRLIKVNGVSVENLPRETIIEMIKNSEEQITVEVQPVSELVELSRRCMHFNDAGMDVTDKATNCNRFEFWF